MTLSLILAAAAKDGEEAAKTSHGLSFWERLIQIGIILIGIFLFLLPDLTPPEKFGGFLRHIGPF